MTAPDSGNALAALPSTQISLRMPDGGVAPPGERGELVAKGPQVMPGYWRRADETAKVMTTDGYFRTGDIAVMEPDGMFRIVDRLKDMILVSGFNVYPNEVEEALSQHPKVKEVAVIGVPEPVLGEEVGAVVVPRPGHELGVEVVAVGPGVANVVAGDRCCSYRITPRT